MKGKHNVIVRNNRLQFKFTLERNITILRGDSATGKTTLIDMIAAYAQNGADSGITVICDKPCVVISGSLWQQTLSCINDSIVFIDEGDRFVCSEAFAESVRDSDNYYVIATRNHLYNLPYSVKEIYGIRNKSGNRYQGTKRLYSEFYPLTDIKTPLIDDPDLVIVEDSHSGYQFYHDLFGEYGIPCISAHGKSNVYGELIQRDYHTVLVIADGAAFGPEIEKVLAVRQVKRVILFLPESFEWMILESDILKSKEVRDILNDPSESIESEKYFSWEQFFTDLLVSKTEGTYLKYEKEKLNPVYLNSKEKKAIQAVMPEIKIIKE